MRFGGIVEGIGLKDVDVVIVALVHVGSLHVTTMTCWCGCVCKYVLPAAGLMFAFAYSWGGLSFHPVSDVCLSMFSCS